MLPQDEIDVGGEAPVVGFCKTFECGLHVGFEPNADGIELALGHMLTM